LAAQLASILKQDLNRPGKPKYDQKQRERWVHQSSAREKGIRAIRIKIDERWKIKKGEAKKKWRSGMSLWKSW
jgi:hypothetical protein